MPSLQGILRIINSRMDDSAVARTRRHAQLRQLFHQENILPTPRKLPRDRAADDSASNNDHIHLVHNELAYGSGSFPQRASPLLIARSARPSAASAAPNSPGVLYWCHEVLLLLAVPSRLRVGVPREVRLFLLPLIIELGKSPCLY